MRLLIRFSESYLGTIVLLYSGYLKVIHSQPIIKHPLKCLSSLF